MPNPYFQFKQFTVYHDRSSLKVSTDSCVFGAWVSEKISRHPLAINRVLDIGAGTGLLMLMLAQKFAGHIDGVEIDRLSYEQATENIKASPWHDRLHLFYNDVKFFSPPHQYDLIISNPPFFEGDLKSVDTKKNLAKHNEGLILSELIEIVNMHLSDHGRFAVLLPYHRLDYFEQLAANYELFVSDKWLIRQTAQHHFFRGMMLLHRGTKGEINTTEMTIHDSPNTYSPLFVALLKDYYLYL